MAYKNYFCFEFIMLWGNEWMIIKVYVRNIGIMPICGHNEVYMRPLAISMQGSGITLGMCSANKRRCYNITTSLIGWVHTWTDYSTKQVKSP